MSVPGCNCEGVCRLGIPASPCSVYESDSDYTPPQSVTKGGIDKSDIFTRNQQYALNKVLILRRLYKKNDPGVMWIGEFVNKGKNGEQGVAAESGACNKANEFAVPATPTSEIEDLEEKLKRLFGSDSESFGENDEDSYGSGEEDVNITDQSGAEKEKVIVSISLALIPNFPLESLDKTKKLSNNEENLENATVGNKSSHIKLSAFDKEYLKYLSIRPKLLNEDKKTTTTDSLPTKKSNVKIISNIMVVSPDNPNEKMLQISETLQKYPEISVIPIFAKKPPDQTKEIPDENNSEPINLTVGLSGAGEVFAKPAIPKKSRFAIKPPGKPVEAPLVLLPPTQQLLNVPQVPYLKPPSKPRKPRQSKLTPEEDKQFQEVLKNIWMPNTDNPSSGIISLGEELDIMERHYKKRFIEQHKLPEANGPLTTKDTNNIRAHPTNQNSSTNLHPVPNNVNPSAISKTKTEKLPTLQISPPKNRRSGVTISKVNPSKKINSKELTSIEAEKRRNNSLIITPIYPAAIPPVLDIEKQTNLQVPQFRVPLVPNLPHVPRLNSAKKSVYNNQALHHVPLHPKPPAPVFTSNNYSTLMQYRSQNENSKSPTSPKKGYEVNDLNVNAKQPTRTYNPRNYPKVLPKSPAVPPQPLPSHSIRNILDMEKPKPAAKIPANYFPPTVNNTERDSGEFQMAYNNFVSKELAERNHVQPTQPYPSESVHPPVNSQENGTLPPFKQTKSRLDNFKPESVIHTSIVKQTAEIVFSGNEFDEMSKDLTTTHRNIIELAGNSSDFATGLLPETPVIPGEICPTPTVHVQGPSDPTISKELVFLSHMLPNEAKGIPTPSTPINAQIDKIIQENVDKVVEEASKYLNLVPATLNVKPATIAQINPQEPPLQPKTVPPSNSREGRVTRPSTSATSTSTGALRLELETPTIGTSLSIPNKNVQSTSNNVVNHEPSSSLVPKACPVVSAQEIIAASSDRIPSISDHVVKEAVNMKEGMEKSANEPTAISSSNLVPKEIATRVYCTNSNVQSTSESVLSENVNQKVEHTAMEIVTTSCNSPDNVQSTSKIENHDEPSLPLVPTESPLDLVVAKKIATPLCTTSTPKKLVEPQQSVSPEMSFTRERIDTLSDLVASDSEALIQKHKSQELVAKSYSSFNRVESVLNRVNVRRIFEIKMVLRKAMARKRRLHFFFSVDQALESPPKKLKLSDNYSDFESNEINENKTIIFLMDYVKSRIKLKNMKPAKNPASTLTKILVPGKFHMLYLKALNNRIFDEIQSLNELTIQTDFVENLPDINNALWKLYDSFLHGGAFTKTRECLLISMQNVLNKLFVKSVEAYGIIISANMAFRWLFMCDVPVIMFSEKRRQFIRLYVPDPKYLKKFLESLNDTPNDEPLNSVEEMHCKKICKALMEVDMELDLSTHREFRKLDEILTPPTSVSSTVSLPNDHPYSSVSSETKDDVKIETKHERCSVITCIKNCTKHETKVEEKMEVEQNEVSTSKLGNTVEANVKLEDKVKMMDESKIDLLDKTKTSPSSYENNVIIIEDEESERERELKAKSKTDQLVSSGLPPSPVPVPRRNKRKLSSEVPDFAPVGGYREEIQWKVILDTTTTYHHRSDASDCSTEPHLPYSPISNIEEDVEEHEPMFLPLEMTGYGGLNPEDVQPLTNPVSDDTPYRYPTCYQLNDPEKIKRLKNASIVFSSLLQPNIGKYRILKSQILDNQKPLRKNHFMPMFGEERHHQILPGFEVHFNDRKISTNFTDDASDCSSDAYTNNLKKQRLCKKARPNYQQNSSSYPKGKMYYYKDSHSLIRYNDDQQMERFLRNVQYPSGDAASNDTEIITLPQDVVFHLKEEISDPVDYINEIDVVKKHVPRDFYSFYKFVSGFQIANRHNPISFTTFLTMHNTNNLKVLLEKYVKTFEEFD